MDKEKELAMNQTYRQFLDAGLGLNSSISLDDIVDDRLMGFGTTVDEKILNNSELKELLARQKEQSKDIDLRWEVKPLSHYTSADENTAFFADEIFLYANVGVESIEMYLRFSVVLSYVNNKWKIIHWHGSKPEQVQSNEDTFGIENWKQKAGALEKLVEERTADLAEKNHELEIEASLERVRTVAMSMSKPDDMLNVCRMISDQLLQLGFKEIRNVQTAIIYEEKYEYLNYQYFTPYDKDSIERIDYRLHPEVLKFSEKMLQSSDAYYTKTFEGKELDAWRQYRKETAQLPDPKLDEVTSSHYYFYSIGSGALGVTTYAALTEDQISLFKRFRNVFQLAYSRFTDIEKAEAQAKEAKTEVALERVRARTMAMQKSRELAEVATVLFQQVKTLGVAQFTCGFGIFEIDDREFTWYPGDANGDILPPVKIPLTEHPVFICINESRKRGDDLYVYEKEGEFQAGHYRYMQSLPGVGEMLQKMLDAGLRFPTFQIDHIANFSHGNLVFITYEHVPDMHDVFKRFAQVFDQTYTRFLDLQKAEEQSREAQIQLALERVRARTMAMQRSDEFMETAVMLFDQLRQLGENIERTIIGVMNEEEGVVDFWATRPDGSQMDKMQKFPIEEPIVMQKVYSAWQQQKKSIVIDISGEELESYFQFLKARSHRLMRERFGKRRVENFVFFSKGMLGIISADPNKPADIGLYERFAAVFDQTYTRFLDLRKSEEQSREVQIELALEKVRSHAMAMQTSDELNQLIGTVFTELTKLDLELTRCVILIYEGAEKGVRWWMANSEVPFMPMNFFVKYADLPFFNAYLEGWHKRKLKWQYILEGDNKIVTDNFLFAETELSQLPDFVVAGMRAPERVYLNASFNNFGNLTLASLAPLSDEHFDILLRFAKVFDLTYTRFNDLKQAEAQAREAKIETALEKVRGRSLAMHKSDELQEVVNTVFERLQELDIEMDSANIAIFKEGSRDFDYWVASDFQKRAASFHMPYTEMLLTKDLIAAREGGTDYSAKTYSLEEKNEWFNYAFTNTDFKFLTDERKQFILNTPAITVSIAFSKYTGVQVIRYSTKLLSEGEIGILKRFSKVFEQAYVRFLDLQKAEAQARESQIEAALERVRSRTMAMQRSDELQDTALVLVQQVKALGVPSFACGFNIWDDDRKAATAWMAGEDRLQPPFKTSSSEDVFLHIHEAAQRGEQLFIAEQGGEELEIHYRYMATIPEFKTVMDKMAEAGLSVPTFQIMHCAFFSHGYLMFISFDPVPEAHDIFKRFAKVFEQTYTRFLDLQKAEAQAREAKIETALERVRSRTMAMQKSEELKEIIRVVYEQFLHLNIVVEHAGFIMDYKATDDMHIWLADRQDIPTEVTFPYFDCAHWNSFNEAKKKRLNFFANLLSFEEKNKFYQDLFQLFPNVPGEAKDYYFKSPGLAISTVLLDNVGLYIENFAAIVYTEEENDILMRFGNVFQQTYTRFLDLQKAEAQAREAQIEASLERVRSKAMAMHDSADVSTATATMFNELTKLGVESMRCGIAILQKDSELMDVWTATVTSDGHDIKGGGLIDTNRHPLWINMCNDWKAGKEFFLYHLKGDDLAAYYKALTSSPNYSASYINEDPPEHYCYVTYFEDGVIFTFNPQIYSGEQKQILKRFASVFSLTYKRYKDLKKAEAQAREAQIEASLERVRSKAMAMQKSEDLADAVCIVFEELDKLNLGMLRCGIGILNREKRCAQVWTTTVSENNTIVQVSGDESMDVHPLLRGAFDAWLNQTDHSYVLKGEDLHDYYKALIDEDFLLPKAQSLVSGRDEVVQYYYNAVFSAGGLFAFRETPFPEEAKMILKRFADVFTITYTRFNDLKQAEAQTREAKIEAALERVRSRTLAMQKSDELAETAAVLFKQLINLGIAPNRLYIAIIKDESGDLEFWITDEDGNRVSKQFIVNVNKNSSIKKMFEGWKANKKALTIDMEGKELEEWLRYWSVEFNIVFKQGAGQQRRVQNVSYFSKGFIAIASPDEQPEETIQLLERFAAVFNLTFTRFNDLKIAEAHAEQAELDLIKLKEEKKKTEDALSELQVTQKQLIQSEKMASLGELTAGIAHEIQNPLNFVNNFSEVSNELIDEMMQEVTKGNYEEVRAIADDVKQNLQKIHHHGQRADGIVKGMLQHSRTGSSQKELVDINVLADEYLRLSYHGLRAKDKSFNAIIETSFDPAIGKINVVPQEIGRVILNLINNAFYAVSEKKSQRPNGYEPTISIVTKRLDDKVEIRVSDNGNGIPQKVLDKIFQPFFTTKPTGQGTGLGLSLSYDVVKAHGGEIKIKTKEGQGSEFIIHMPFS